MRFSTNPRVQPEVTTKRRLPLIFANSGYEKITLVGHDIGLMAAYSYASRHPSEVEELALLEAPIPLIGDIWEKVYTTPALWHFHFVNSPIALELVEGRECIFLEHFWQTLSPHSEADRQIYAKAYGQERRCAGGV